MLALDHARRAIRREVASALDELQRLDEDAWERPTRCQGWTVADLVGHLVWGQRLEAQAVEGAATGRSVPIDVPKVSVVRPGELLEQLRTAHQELGARLDALTAAELARPAPMPYGAVPVALLLQVVTMEVGVHHSDLRAAADLPAGLEPDVVRATAAALEAFLPVLAGAGTRPDRPVVYRLAGRAGDLDLTIGWDGERWSSAAGERPTVTLSGPDSDVCLFALGRAGLDGDWAEVDGDRAAADRFKEFVPGP